ncbi:integral membrane [Pyrenophora seminiperda CCB06]|uniref:Integral membrane n=1 Tax=Pyrenophora seminiperda CCB06 TaxID=1302712 RepID=A0A3M7MGL3_9PLEO|nr:integral membrane [Pyrenophora seminiperda CCB06]
MVFTTSLVSAQQNTTTTNTTAASTFYLDKTETQFSINIADDSDDVFIYFTSPAYSWVGVGFGSEMKDSLMIVMYQSGDGNNITLSPRLGSPSSEPSFAPSIALHLLPGTTTNKTSSMLILRARCTNCRSYFDTTSTSQPMIYAFGKAQNLQSDDPSAHLQRHIEYGHFTMDMTAARGAGGVPAPSSVANGVGGVVQVRDHDRRNIAHAVVGGLAVLVLWPVNVLCVAVFKSVRVHVVLSGLIVVFLMVSFVLGGLTSGQYVKSKAFSTPHQIFAFLSLIPLLGTSLLPPLARLTPNINLRPLHTPFACASFILLVITGGLGLSLSGQPIAIILVYTALALAASVFLLIVHACIRKRGSAHARRHQKHQHHSNNGSQEESDRALMLSAMEERGSSNVSAASLSKQALFYGAPVPHSLVSQVSSESGVDRHGHGGQHRSAKSESLLHYGGGTMPGPQYLLNMHPGVPVQVSRM